MHNKSRLSFSIRISIHRSELYDQNIRSTVRDGTADKDTITDYEKLSYSFTPCPTTFT